MNIFGESFFNYAERKPATYALTIFISSRVCFVFYVGCLEQTAVILKLFKCIWTPYPEV